ncbi:protein psi1-like [Salvia divinorum]|uniref:Protein psi1-like n=1 Tax=Salvia divinorum TaxID=28513 RepID=A0ABD1FP35_SALDI
MGEYSKPNPSDLIRLLGIANVYRACKSFLSKCYPEKQPFFLKKTPITRKPKPIEDTKISRSKTKKHMEGEKLGTGSDSPRLSRNLSYHSRISQPLGRAAKGHLSRAFSDIQTTRGARARAGAGGLTSTFSRNMSKGVAAPIIFSNSSGLLKPAAMEKQLECTLEELCFGCIKKVAITRDAYKGNGQIVEEDEMVIIKVEPGWRRGTKITFEGKGNQMPGAGAADVVFMVAEKEHSLFKRRDDDLLMGIEIMLVDALSGCTLLLPLLGGETTSFVIEDIVHPGYVKTIEGQGMPKQHEHGTRGGLIVNISVKFPDELTQEQRTAAAAILQQTC